MAKMKYKKTAAFMRGARSRLQVTQAQFADMLDVERYNVAKYERGSVRPPGDIILKTLDLVRQSSRP